MKNIIKLFTILLILVGIFLYAGNIDLLINDIESLIRRILSDILIKLVMKYFKHRKRHKIPQLRGIKIKENKLKEYYQVEGGL